MAAPFTISSTTRFFSTSRSLYGENDAVAPGATVTLVTRAADINWYFLGIIAGGESDATFVVEFDDVPHYTSRTNIVRRAGDFMLPKPDLEARDKIITVKVTNNGEVTSAFEATLIGAPKI